MSVSEDQLKTWTAPSSDAEQEKQDRTERMIREAIDAHPGFDGYRSLFSVYAKGSYANNTNVKFDSDVDIVVECSDVEYWRNADRDNPGYSGGTPYQGVWTPEKLRTEIGAALRSKFPGFVSEGSTAFEVNASSSRVNADVVPSFTFKLYYSSGNYARGTKVFKKDGTSVENYPNQQLENGRSKNSNTNFAYKKAVRILKRLENTLVEKKLAEPVPSFVLECLIYNCPDEFFTRGSWRAVMRACLAEIFNHTLKPEADNDRWLESNGIKYLFHLNQKWTLPQIHKFADAAWDYMEFD
ncbi:nucleotidyltransferase [Leucobacter sp. cx-328]|uniref:nucleotidyltransferase domain-containing protein n=1 Tax=unclassified Leucobacter TaxID=2621730 RepID=UPI00165D34CE|nr:MULTISPECIES: nucleotidyltransferase [unclassified Leucobacter]MBC9944178.1 nucleotidyltransferase [Leucobacter sp. cx-328]